VERGKRMSKLKEARQKAFEKWMDILYKEYGVDMVTEKGPEFYEGIFNAGWRAGRRYKKHKRRLPWGGYKYSGDSKGNCI